MLGDLNLSLISVYVAIKNNMSMLIAVSNETQTRNCINVLLLQIIGWARILSMQVISLYMYIELN